MFAYFIIDRSDGGRIPCCYTVILLLRCPVIKVLCCSPNFNPLFDYDHDDDDPYFIVVSVFIFSLHLWYINFQIRFRTNRFAWFQIILKNNVPVSLVLRRLTLIKITFRRNCRCRKFNLSFFFFLDIRICNKLINF